MKILVPVLSGREADALFVDAVTSKVDEVILLQIVDKDFHPRAGSAVGEVRQLRIVVDDLRKAIGTKRKKYSELTEWGSTLQKIVSLALLSSVDKVVMVNQDNQFFQSIVSELNKKKVKVELIDLPVEVVEDKPKRKLW